MTIVMNLVGSVLGKRYEILEEIGSGGMAIVYKARCNVLNRYVAIKVLRNDLKDDAEFVRRFNIEAQAAASLTHPNIVSIYDVGNDDGVQYIVMEYVKGITLKRYIDRKEKLPWREAVGYAMQICRALEAAHAHNIIHRDIKPQNIIMAEDGTLKVTDFGIAHASSQSTMTVGNNAIGTVHYLSPEQARGGYTDERSDIYSLGIVLYEMLTGRVPFDNDSPVTIAIKHLQEKPIPPREYNITIPLSLEQSIMKSIAKEQALRYRTAGEILSDLKGILDNPELSLKESVTADDSITETQKLPDLKNRQHYPTDIEQTDEEKENMPMHEPNRKPSKKKKQVVLDKKKERRVVIFAVIAAVVVIGLMAFAFFSLSGLGTVLSPKNEVEIPQLVGKNIEDVQRQYKDTRFNIVEADTTASTEEKGTILTQDPEAKKKVSVADEKTEIVINVTVSDGSDEIQLKDYTKYTDVRSAEIDLKKDGFRVNTVKEFHDSVPIDAIIRQSPTAGTKMEKDDTVTLYVSKGPENGDDDQSPSPTPSNTPSAPPSNSPSTDNTPSPPPSEQPKKSAYLTIHGPKDKDSAQVQVKANGKNIFNKQMASGTSELLKIEGTSATAEVEIFYDGVSAQKQTIDLN